MGVSHTWKLPFMNWNQQTADYYAGHCIRQFLWVNLYSLDLRSPFQKNFDRFERWQMVGWDISWFHQMVCHPYSAPETFWDCTFIGWYIVLARFGLLRIVSMIKANLIVLVRKMFNKSWIYFVSKLVMNGIWFLKVNRIETLIFVPSSRNHA